MDVNSRRSRMLKRFIGVVLVTSVAIASVVAAVRYREWRSERAHRERLSVVKAVVKPGMSSAEIEKVLGEPTFIEQTISKTFEPTDATCRRRSRSSFIYQAMPEPTLVVFFDEQNRVTCSETTTTFMIMHRVEYDPAECLSSRSRPRGDTTELQVAVLLCRPRQLREATVPELLARAR